MSSCEECTKSGIDLCRMCRLERKVSNMTEEIRFLKHVVDMLCASDLRIQSRSEEMEEVHNSISWLKVIVDVLSSQLCYWNTTNRREIFKRDGLAGKVDELMSLRDQVEKVVEELNKLKTVTDGLNLVNDDNAAGKNVKEVIQTSGDCVSQQIE